MQASYKECREEEPYPQAVHGAVCQHCLVQSGGKHVHPCSVQALARHLCRQSYIPGALSHPPIHDNITLHGSVHQEEP